MQKIKVASINNVFYCKFPEGINDIKEFIQFLNNNYHSFIELEFYIEKGCVAPFYIEENLKTVKEYWNPSHMRCVKEAEISVLPRIEYEEKLKKVIEEKCVNCVNYIDDEDELDLESHCERIDLDGNCYNFEKKK